MLLTAVYEREKKIKRQSTKQLPISTNELKQTQQPNQEVGKKFLFSCTYMQLCYLELSGVFFLICCGQDTEQVKIPVIMHLIRNTAGISSLTYLGVHLSSFSSVSPCSELQLLCAHVLYGWQGVLSSAWAHLLPNQSFSTTFKNMLNIFKVITIYFGNSWVKRQDLISYQRKEVLWYMWCGWFLGFLFLGFF